MEKFEVTYKKYSQHCNLTLLKSRNREHLKDQIIDTYIQIFKILDRIDNSGSRIEMYRLNEMIEPLEFKLQELWGFNKDANYHRFWFEINSCTCPKMDNIDDLGTGYRHINTQCMIHGSYTFNLANREKKLKRILKNN